MILLMHLLEQETCVKKPDRRNAERESEPLPLPLEVYRPQTQCRVLFSVANEVLVRVCISRSWYTILWLVLHCKRVFLQSHSLHRVSWPKAPSYVTYSFKRMPVVWIRWQPNCRKLSSCSSEIPSSREGVLWSCSRVKRAFWSESLFWDMAEAGCGGSCCDRWRDSRREARGDQEG